MSVVEPLVSIITVNYNQPKATAELLESIRRQDYRNLEVFVVDNASAENPETFFRSHYPEIHFIRSERNLGFAGGNNLAVAKTQGAFLFFVNNDAELTEGCIRSLLDQFEQVPQLGLVSPLICYFPNEKWAEDMIQYAGMTPIDSITGRNRTIGQGEWDRGQFKAPYSTAYAHGAAMMTSRKVMEKTGGMAEDFFLYYEELDWSARIREKGYDIRVEPRAKILHKESLTMAQLGPLKTYYLNRNRVWFMRRHIAGWRLALFYLFLFGITIPKNVIKYTLRGENGNLKAFWKGIWWNFDGVKQDFTQ